MSINNVASNEVMLAIPQMLGRGGGGWGWGWGARGISVNRLECCREMGRESCRRVASLESVKITASLGSPAGHHTPVLTQLSIMYPGAGWCCCLLYDTMPVAGTDTRGISENGNAVVSIIRPLPARRRWRALVLALVGSVARVVLPLVSCREELAVPFVQSIEGRGVTYTSSWQSGPS